MSSPRVRPLWYALWPLALLLVEYLWISVRFDALPLLESAGLASGFGHLGILAPLAIVVATATYTLSGKQLRAEFALQWLAAGTGSRAAVGLATNLLSYAGLHWLTAALLERAAQGAAIRWPWLLAWLLLSAATALTLLFTLLPWRALRAFVRHAGDALVLGVGAGALAWTAGLASERFWDGLRVWTLYSVYWLMLPFSEQLVFVPQEAAIGVDDFVVLVAPECSGIEGIGLILTVMALYLYSARRRLRMARALWLLPVAVIAVWFGNALRIALLIGVGATISPDIALSGFHSKAGWLFFCAIALSLIALAQRVRWLSRDDELSALANAELEQSWNPAATYLAPLLSLIATALVTALWSTGFDRWYALRIVAVLAALYLQRRRLPRPAWPASWHAPAIGGVVFVLWLMLVTRPGAQQVHDFRAHIAELGQPWAALWLALRALGSIVSVPIAEELAFRAFLLRRLIDVDFSEVDKTRLTPAALAISSLAFGLLHPGAWIPGTLAGVAYAFAQHVRGRTADAIVAHAVTNGLIAAAVLLFDAYWLWV